MLGVGQQVPDKPKIPDAKTRRLRVSLIIEEALELAFATGVAVAIPREWEPGVQQHASIADRNDVKIPEEGSLVVTGEPDYRRDCLQGAADAYADLLYVVYGAAIAYGLDMEPIFAEVQRSNMTKLFDGYKHPETGKWIKGPKYSPANLKPIVDAQIDGTPVPPQVKEKVPFLKQLQNLINCNSMENESDTPDFILASYLEGCLKVFGESVRAREAWYGRAKQSLGLGTSAPEAPPAQAPLSPLERTLLAVSDRFTTIAEVIEGEQVLEQVTQPGVLSVQLRFRPVRPGTVQLSFGDHIALDDGNGFFIPTGSFVGGSIHYESGAIIVEIKGAGKPLVASYIKKSLG